jgi:hypothetical protein
MKHLFKNHAAIIITGAEGCGKSLLARAIADSCGGSLAIPAELLLKTGFAFSGIDANVSTVVVDEVTDKLLNSVTFESVIGNRTLTVNLINQETLTMPMPNFILIKKSGEALNMPKHDRRFLIIDMASTESETINENDILSDEDRELTVKLAQRIAKIRKDNDGMANRIMRGLIDVGTTNLRNEVKSLLKTFAKPE